MIIGECFWFIGYTYRAIELSELTNLNEAPKKDRLYKIISYVSPTVSYSNLRIGVIAIQFVLNYHVGMGVEKQWPEALVSGCKS